MIRAALRFLLELRTDGMIPNPIERFPFVLPEPPKAVSGTVAAPMLSSGTIPDSRGFREDERRAVNEAAEFGMARP